MVTKHGSVEFEFVGMPWRMNHHSGTSYIVFAAEILSDSTDEEIRKTLTGARIFGKPVLGVKMHGVERQKGYTVGIFLSDDGEMT